MMQFAYYHGFWMYLLCVALTTLVLLHGHGASTEGASRPDLIRIGAIFTLKTINGRVSKIAIEAAERDVNADPRILGGRKLSITVHDSNFNGFVSFIGGIRITPLSYLRLMREIHIN